MKNFMPYQILHIQIKDIHQIVPLNSNCYLVIWFNSIPLGHIWIDGEQREEKFKNLLNLTIDAVQGTVGFYIDSKKLSQSNWRLHFTENNVEKLNQEFNKIFYTVNAQESDHKLSVVVCTRNRPRAIEECIRALLNSNDKDFELIVIDNAPDDDLTEEVVKKYPAVKYLKELRKGLDIARNTGARHAMYEIVAYTDDDVLVDINWTKQLKSLFVNPKTMAITGLVIPVSLDTKAQYIFEKEWGFNNGYLPKLFDEHYFAAHVDDGVPVWDIGAGANMAFRREVFNYVGWFDERLDVGASGCSGDSEFWYRILADGFHCQYYPQLFVFHQHREEMTSLKRQIFSYMRGQVSSVLVQYENYHNYGDLIRIKKILPNYYFKKILGDIRHLRPNSFLNTINEIRGCISGWLFFRRNRNLIREGNILYLKSLKEDVLTNENSLVSIIVPCYNHAQYLTIAIESVLRQSYKNYEIIVIDDGSTDHTSTVCSNYPQVKYIRANRLGLSGARNLGVYHAKGEFLVFLDADDYLYPDALKVNLGYFVFNKKAVFVSGSHDRVNNNGELLDTAAQIEKWADNYEGLLHGNYIAMEGTIMYRSALFYTFYFDPLLKACEDYDINLNITRHFPSITHSEKIAAYRIHDHNMSADKKLMQNNVIKVLERQKGYLRGDSEIEAYNKGLYNWKHYYSR
ncbi:glycosyltransferase involved in cell wall biosynthesis [Pedobacter sp. UYEF25]